MGFSIVEDKNTGCCQVKGGDVRRENVSFNKEPKVKSGSDCNVLASSGRLLNHGRVVERTSVENQVC